MFAVFEGGDGVGKSTLAEAVAKAIQDAHPDDTVELLHRGPPERSVFDEYAFDVDDYRPGTGRHIVADRWHLGTLVYAKLYRGLGDYGELGVAGFRWVELFLKSRGANVWLVDHPTEKVRERLAIRGEDFLLPKDLEWCLDRFREITPWSTLSRGVIDTSLDKLPHIVSDVMRVLNFRDQDYAPFARFPGYVGGRKIHTLLVGERHGGKPPHKSEAAFIVKGKNSSEFLLSALPDPFWRGVGLVNAYETNVRDLIMSFDAKPDVVALGRAASKNLADLDVDHAAVPHPQYVRRFANTRRDAYGALIERVARTGEQRFAWPK